MPISLTTRLSCCLMLVLLASLRAAATTIVVLDGDYWLRATQADRIQIIESGLSGLQTGYIYGTYTAVVKHYVAIAPSAKVYEAHRAWIMATASRLAKAASPRYTKTFGTYADEVNGFYETYPSAAKVLVTQVLWCLRDGEQHQQCESALRP